MIDFLTQNQFPHPLVSIAWQRTKAIGRHSSAAEQCFKYPSSWKALELSLTGWTVIVGRTDKFKASFVGYKFHSSFNFQPIIGWFASCTVVTNWR